MIMADVLLWTFVILGFYGYFDCLLGWGGRASAGLSGKKL